MGGGEHVMSPCFPNVCYNRGVVVTFNVEVHGRTVCLGA